MSVAASLLLAAALSSASTSSGSAPVPSRTVTLQDIAFTPSVLRVRRGQAVTWVWNDPNVPHDVRSRGRPRFRGSSARQTGMHRVRFFRSGTYHYVCTIHPGMRGRVVVRR